MTMAAVVAWTGFADSTAVVAARQVAEQERGAGKRGWLAWEAERNQYFPAQNLERVKEIAALLPARAEIVGDPARFRAEWAKLAATAEGRKKIDVARRTLSEPIPELTVAAYEAYRKTGNRATYDAAGQRSQMLAKLVWGEVLEGKGAFIGRIAEVLDAICDEPSWIAPYEGGLSDIGKPLHGTTHYIDLTASARAAQVALATSWFHGQLPSRTREHAHDVLRGRVFETFLKDARRTGETTPYCNWWMPDRFNWSAVCHNGCTTAILAAEDDPRVRAEAIEVSERLMAPCFLDGFLADGYCEEGMGYWNYGYGNFLQLAAIIKDVTKGQVDFCKAFPRAKLVAGFGAKYRMGHGSSPLFADGNGTAAKSVLLLVNMNWPEMYRAEVQGLSPFTGDSLFTSALMNCGPFKFTPPPAEKLADLPPRDWFAAAETLICRADALAFAIKGGSNGDRHNHNDAGSYLIDFADREIAGDPGNENYTARTFSRRRYESKVLNSHAHPVPRVGGELQGTGPAFGARLVKTDFSDEADTIVYDLAGAYPAKVPIERLLRTATFNRKAGTIAVTDEAVFAAPTTFESPVIAWRKPIFKGEKGAFQIPTGGPEAMDVTVRAEGGDWKLSEEFIENPHRTQPYRVAVAFEKPVQSAKITVVYHLGLLPQMGMLTPKAKAEPRINGARIFGVRPGHPVLWRIPVTGERPMTVEVTGLPAGVVYDPKTCSLAGSTKVRGDHDFLVTAKNAKGTATRRMTLRVGDRLCLTPPMGWNSWNCWGQDVTDARMRKAADAMVATGLADHGWNYIVVEDCWRTRPTEKEAGFARPGWIGDKAHMYGESRFPDGTPKTNAAFPDMKAMADHIHGLGLRAGLYSVPSEVACCYTFGSWKYEAKDAETWAKWGYDLVKYDWCYGDRQYAGTAPTRRQWQFNGYRKMGDLLAKQPRDIVYNVCNYGLNGVTEWARAAGGHYWRTNDDVKDTWELLIKSIDANLKVADAAGPGGWNDPDMLVIGPMRSNGFTKSRLTPNEQYTHMSLWAIQSAPLFIGCDMERLAQDPLAWSFLTNDEVIDIDQDELGKVGRPVVHTKDYDVWARPLVDGSWAVALFNRTWEPRSITAVFKDFGAADRLVVRDVWAQKDLGAFDNQFTTEVYGHATRLFRLWCK